MSSIVTALTGGGPNGANFQAGSANILNPARTQQAQDLYGQSQSGINQQQNFVNALQAQNGLGNQSSVFNQLQGVANGTGPNPAKAMLAQSTGANTANQAALMAGQRGSGANAGLIARQAAQQGGANQQQAAGQAATMQANQSLNALGQLGGMAGQQVAQQAAGIQGLNAATQGEQGQILGAIQGQNQANVSNASQQNEANAKIAATNAQMQGNLVGNIMGGAGSAMSMLGGGGGGAGAALGPMMMLAAQGGKIPQMYADGTGPGGVQQTGSYLPVTGPSPFDSPAPSIPPIPSTSSATPAIPTPGSGPQSKIGKFFSNAGSMTGGGDDKQTGIDRGGQAIGKAIGSGLSAGFGALKGAFNSSPIGNPVNDLSSISGQGVQQYNGTSAPGSASDQLMNVPNSPSQGLTGNDNTTMAGANGGEVPVLLSPGEKVLSPKEAKLAAEGKANPMALGKKVPGKAPVPGAKNDYANDIYPSKEKPGSVVLPRSVTQAPDKDKRAIEFIRAVEAKKGRRQLPKKAK